MSAASLLAGAGARAHAGLEQPPGPAARRLRGVERLVGMGDERMELGRIIGEDRKPRLAWA